jgi:hypothetical protein
MISKAASKNTFHQVGKDGKKESAIITKASAKNTDKTIKAKRRTCDRRLIERFAGESPQSYTLDFMLLTTGSPKF